MNRVSDFPKKFRYLSLISNLFPSESPSFFFAFMSTFVGKFSPSFPAWLIFVVMSSNIRTRKEIEKSIAVLLEGRFGTEGTPRHGIGTRRIIKEDKTKMFEKMMAGSRKLSFSFLAAAFAATVFIGFAPSQAEARMASVEQEREWAQETLEEDQAKYEMVQAEPGSPLRRIQDRLIQYNSDRLNYNDGKHDRWLEPVWLNMSTMKGSAWSQGGYVLIANETVRKATFDGTFEERDIYGSSMVAKTLAHEFAHFANEDVRKGNTRTSAKMLACEYRADKDSLEFLSNVPEFSIGSRLSQDTRLSGGGINIDTGERTHPADEERTQMVRDTIKEWSNGRVELDRNCRMTYDGKLFNGTGYVEGSEVFDDNIKERTAYLAGQIADCIRRGVWKRENVAGAKETYFYKDGASNRSVLAVFKDTSLKGAPVKILGNFNFDYAKAKSERTADEQKEVDVYNAIMDLSES